MRSFPQRSEYPLSLQQFGIWNWCQIHPTIQAYNYSSDMALRGPLDVARLHRALHVLVTHHESLGVVFATRAGRPVQRFGTWRELPLPQSDLRGLGGTAQERQIHRLHRDVGLRLYDLERGPLVRFHLARTGEREHRLLVAFHHLAIDGPSLERLCRTLLRLYAGLAEGATPPAPPALRYRDFVLWQVEALAAGALAPDERHWLSRFRPPLPELELPGSRLRPRLRSFRGGQVEVPLAPEGVVRLRALQARFGVSAFRFCLAAFNVLLYRLTGEVEPIVGVPATCRPPELPDEVGHFAVMVPVRTAVDGAAPFSACLDQVRAQLRQALEHRAYPFEAVVGRLGLERDPNRLPVYSVACTQVAPPSRLTEGDLELVAREVVLDWAFFDLNLAVREDGDGLELVLHYDRDLFDRAAVAGIADSLAALLGALVECPETPVDRLDILGASRAAQLRLGPRPRRESHPLAFNQRDLWAQYMLLPPNPYYNCFFAATVEGPTDTGSLRRAVLEVLARHEILGATFHVVEGRPRMRFGPRRMDCPVEDLAALGEAAQAAQVAARERTLALAPFDLERGPLTRQSLLRLGPGRHRLILVIHHLLHDQPAMGELLREIADHAVRRAQGGPPPAPLAVQYRDFADWQDEQLRAGMLAAHGRHWRWVLAGPPPALDLPADRPRSTAQTHRGAYVVRVLPSELRHDLQALRESHGLTQFRVLLGAFAVLVARWCAVREVVLAVPISTRPREIAQVNGYFSLAVPIRLDVARDRTFRSLLDQVDGDLRAAIEHRQYPLVEIYRRLAHDPGRPLFAVCVSQTRALEGGGDGWTLTAGTHDTPGVVFDLWALFEQAAGGLELRLKYNTDLFERATVERLVACFVELLASGVREPDEPVGRLRLLPTAERQRLEGYQRPSGSGPPTGESLAARVATQASARGDAVAAADGGRHLTYSALAAAAARLAAGLRDGGGGFETRVAVLGGRGLELLQVALGIAWAGAVYVPLESGHPDARLRTILADCRPRWLLADARQRPRAVALAAGLEPAPDVVGWGDLLGRRDPGAMPAAGHPEALAEALANVFYTSGSTGRPKGAMVTFRGMLNHLWAKVELLGLDADCAVAQNASAGFDISVWQMFAPLLAGGRTVFYDDPAAVATAGLLERVERDQVSVLETVPSLLEAMLSEAPPDVTLPALRHLISNAETLPPALARRWHKRFPRVALLNTYGATECSDDVTHQVLRSPPAAGDPRVGVGGPIAGMRAHVVDRHRLELVPAGWPGEVALAGVGVGRGYLADPRKTAAAFVPDPWSAQPGARLYRTGDLGRFGSGGLEFLGRVDHQVKVRGHRIELGEVEAALLALPGVRQAVAVVRVDAAGSGRVIAYAVADGGAAGELRERLRERLPAAMLPDAVVELDALPRTANGKVDRAALPAPGGGGRRAAAALPRTPLERRLVEVWREVLGDPEIGVDDNFFEAGGDSIKSIQVASRLRREGLVVEPRRLFQHQTVALLARDLEESGAAPPPAPAAQAGVAEVGDEERARLEAAWDAGAIEGVHGLSPLQEGMLFHTLLEPEGSPYQEQVVQRLAGPLDAARFTRALAWLVRRHPLLRTVFVEAPRPLQAVLRPGGAVPALTCDLRGLPSAQRQRVRERVEEALFRRPLAPTRRPPLRFCLLLLEEAENVLVWTFNHVLLDGWSSGLLLRDLLAIYDDLGRGREPAAADFPPYRRFLDWLATQDRDAARAFWRRELAGVDRPTPLPADRRPGRPERGRRRQVVRAVGPVTLEALRRFGAARRAPPSFVWQAAWAAALARAAGTDEALFGLVLLGRPDELPGVDRMVGPFIATVPLRVAVPPTATAAGVVGELMRRYSDRSRHAHLPLAEVQGLSEIRPPGRLFESLLDIHRSPGAPIEVGDLRLAVEEAEGGRGGTSFDLAIDVVVGDPCWLRAHYAPEAFDARTVSGLLESLEGWALSLCAAPDTPLAEVRPRPPRSAETGLSELESEVLEELGAELGG